MLPSQVRRIDDAPPTCRRVLKLAYTGDASPRQAIKAFCLQCLAYNRADVAACTAPACPLFAYRPFQRGDEADDDQSDGQTALLLETA
jgi:hypothetical protein